MVKRNLVFATNNAHKLEEIRAIAGNAFNIVSLKDIGCFEDIPETADTIEGNARMKARYVSEKFGVDCFADDTGLEVDALGGAPGVHTARYGGGDGHDSAANMRLLMKNLEGETNRSARFLTVIALIMDCREFIFEGECRGSIATRQSGSGGFGYDPVFVPEGYSKTFAELTSEEKNSISHRGRATRRLVDHLASQMK